MGPGRVRGSSRWHLASSPALDQRACCADLGRRSDPHSARQRLAPSPSAGLHSVERLHGPRRARQWRISLAGRAGVVDALHGGYGSAGLALALNGRRSQAPQYQGPVRPPWHSARPERLLRHAQLPHLGRVTNQPRSRGPSGAGTHIDTGGAGGARTHDPRIMRALDHEHSRRRKRRSTLRTGAFSLVLFSDFEPI